VGHTEHGSAGVPGHLRFELSISYTDSLRIPDAVVGDTPGSGYTYLAYRRARDRREKCTIRDIDEFIRCAKVARNRPLCVSLLVIRIWVSTRLLAAAYFPETDGHAQGRSTSRAQPVGLSYAPMSARSA